MWSVHPSHFNQPIANLSLRVIEPIVQAVIPKVRALTSGARDLARRIFDLTTVAISWEVAVISPVIVVFYVPGAPRLAVFETWVLPHSRNRWAALYPFLSARPHARRSRRILA
jgi:hypothetical protein